MASTASSKTPLINPDELADFSQHLQSSNRILALLGAGLSASSGLPTFRGAGGLWRTHDATDLATPEAFSHDPALVWHFYSYRRHLALKAKPNLAHYALAELARQKEGFMTLSQNVDGLSQRAGHGRDRLMLLHGSLFDIKCTGFYCKYNEENNFVDPIVPALALPTATEDGKTVETDPTSNEARQKVSDAVQSRKDAGKTAMGNGEGSQQKETELDISDEKVALPELAIKDLPRCPECNTGLLRPGVVWFGEMLPEHVIGTVDDWIVQSKKIDLILVIGTSAKVYPAAGYVDRARAKGASKDWFFEGDAAQIVPEILKSVVGDVHMPREDAAGQKL